MTENTLPFKNKSKAEGKFKDKLRILFIKNAVRKVTKDQPKNRFMNIFLLIKVSLLIKKSPNVGFVTR